MSTPAQAFSNLTESKRFINVPPSNTTVEPKLNVSRNMADNYCNNQINIHELIPLSPIPPSLVSLGSALSAAYYNYWQSPEKTDLGKDVKMWEKNVLEYILTNYGKKNPNGLSGGTPFGVTNSMTGNSRG